MPAEARLDMWVDPHLKAEAERAAALIGSRSLSEFVTQAIREKTATVLRERERMVLADRIFDDFFAACLADEGPNQKLREAAERHDAQGFE